MSKKQNQQRSNHKKQPAPIIKTPPRPKRNYYLIILVAITSLVYLSSLQNGWTDWDDEGYVLQDTMVKTFDVPQIFSSYVVGNYHPVTILVMAAEYVIFDESAAGYHTVSLLLHILNCLLVFWFIGLLTRKKPTAFIVALLFAIHPLHVESVSWISEQKDLLYVLFYLLTLILYLRYDDEQKKDRTKYLLVLLFFVLSLLSKAQAVTLPVILVLIDWYRNKKISIRQQIDKIPLFAIAFAMGIVAIFAQKSSSAIQDITAYTWGERLMFASFATVSYLWRLFIPVHLSAYYSYPYKLNGSYPPLIYIAPLIVVALAGWVFFMRKKYPVLVFGSLFFFINILLVLQLLPIGGAITADRYSYLSFIGLFFVIGVALNDWWEKRNSTRSLPKFLLATAGAWIVFLAVSAFNRTVVWKNSETLFTDVIAKYDNVPVAYNNLGWYYLQHNQLQDAKRNFNLALQYEPDFTNALINQYFVYKKLNITDSALMDVNRLIKLKSDIPDLYEDRGVAYAFAGKTDSALLDFRTALRLKPHYADVYQNLGNLFSMMGNPDSAIRNYSLAFNYNDSLTGIFTYRGLAFLHKSDYKNAIDDFTRAISVDPNNGYAYYYRMQCHQGIGESDKAYADGLQAQKLGVKVSTDSLDMLRKSAQ